VQVSNLPHTNQVKEPKIVIPIDFLIHSISIAKKIKIAQIIQLQFIVEVNLIDVNKLALLKWL
jgi:hypothetical protein